MKQFLCTLTEPIVQTKAGKLRGFQYDGIYTFHGIRYAKARRFEAPRPVKPWEGVKDALSYGYICPTLGSPRPVGEVMTPHRFWPTNENCQYLNVWSPALGENEKKPVMVWFHGGGYSDGSSIEQSAYDGANLARYGDVVVVTVNHRLNVFGFLDMSAFGEQYKNSANAGVADLVAALQWVHDNIAGFGGDPDNVTIFGQSGGGGKVTDMGQMPAAAGLFHRAIVMSGVLSGGIMQNDVDGEELARAILKELDPDTDDIQVMIKAPTTHLIEAVNAAVAKFRAEGRNVSWRPSANEWHKGDPLHVDFSDYYRTIPTMVGTVIGEFNMAPMTPDKEALSEEERRQVIVDQFGEEKADKLIEMYKKAYPGKNIVYAKDVDTMFRPATIAYLHKKAAESSAPVYSYMFGAIFPYGGGTPCGHCSDIGYFFHNADLVPATQIPGVTDRLEQEMFSAFVNFARTGDPNGEGLPKWDPCTAEELHTMIFDEKTEVRTNHDEELVPYLDSIKPPFSFDFAAMMKDDDDDDEGQAWVY
ncbi:MAG: carboxylesterase family protein [Lachnospiraceae bacterium]|nr:carboxylesterase family protein [Lachnospiraceae bacterium]